MKLLITGANGYIGQRIVALARRHGHKVVLATRRATPTTPLEHRTFDLSRAPSEDLLTDIDIVIHLAANVGRSREISRHDEVETARTLAILCQRTGALLVFVSSQTASPVAPTDYGITKWSIEQVIRQFGGVSVRPGQVYGGYERGLFGELVAFLRKSPFIPWLIPSPKVQPVHVDDLCEAILRVAEGRLCSSEPLCIAEPVGVPFDQFLSRIASSWLRVHRIRLPIPLPVLRASGICIGPAMSERLGLSRLLSLSSLAPMETNQDLARLGLSLRPHQTALMRGRRDRELLREGRAMLSYVLRATPPSSLVRRYVRCVRHQEDNSALGLSKLHTCFPSLLALSERQACGTLFVRRLDFAMLIAEASTFGCERFVPSRDSPPIAALVVISRAVLWESLLRIVALARYPRREKIAMRGQ